jgi:hypothetical protein
MVPAPNDNIVSLVITVRLVAGNSPGFELAADDASGGGPGSLRFSCSGIGHSNEGLLKEILGKIIASYPTQPIRLCLQGQSIVPDALCGAAPTANLVAVAAAAVAAPQPKAAKKAAAKTKTKTKTKATAKTKKAKGPKSTKGK